MIQEPCASKNAFKIKRHSAPEILHFETTTKKVDDIHTFIEKPNYEFEVPSGKRKHL